jgi:DNA-binding transcriptional ArsR family regulator
MDAFAALADPVRRSLLDELSDGPLRVVDLAASRAISRPAVSRHLRVLLDAGLVVAADRGRERHYAVEPAGLEPVAALLVRLVVAASPLTGQALDALDTEVRRTAREHRARARVRTTKETA